MRAAVTGAGGFAGAWLCRHLLAAGDAVVGYVRRPPAAPVPGVRYRALDLVTGDLAAALERDAPDALYHLAACTQPAAAEADPGAAWAINADATARLFAALPPAVPALLASTCHVYGAPRFLPITEDHPLAPSGVYARTKRAAEAAAAAHPRAVIARAFHHTGPGQDPRYALAGFAAQVAAGGPVVAGDLALRRDYSDVRDVVAGYRVLLTRGAPGRAYNLCSGEAPALGARLAALMGPDPLPVRVDPARVRPDDPPEIRGDASAARALGWAPAHDLGETLREMVRETVRETVRKTVRKTLRRAPKRG